MKTFSEYLAEGTKNYKYVVKLSFKPDDDLMTRIERSLGKYNLVNITAPRSLPIRQVDKDFPGIKAPEVYTFNVEVAYPAAAENIRHTLANLGMEFLHVVVINDQYNELLASEEEAFEKQRANSPILTKDYEKQDNAAISANNYGDVYNEKLIKNSIGTTGEMIPDELKKKTAERTGDTLNNYPTGKKSPVGSTKGTKLDIKSFAR